MKRGKIEKSKSITFIDVLGKRVVVSTIRRFSLPKELRSYY